MPSRLMEIFEDEKLINRIKTRLLYLFQRAELESSRAGKIGMEVGSLRERIIFALFLIYKFGEANVKTEIPITEPEIDVRLFGNPVSIKTITGKDFGGVKLIWTVDAQKARNSVKPIIHTVLRYASPKFSLTAGLPIRSERYMNLVFCKR